MHKKVMSNKARKYAKCKLEKLIVTSKKVCQKRSKVLGNNVCEVRTRQVRMQMK